MSFRLGTKKASQLNHDRRASQTYPGAKQATEKERMSLTSTSKLKSTLLGALAGVLGLLTIVLGVYFALFLFTLVFMGLGELGRSMSEYSAEYSLQVGPTALSSLGESLRGVIQNVLTGLWRDRLGFLVLALLGAMASWGHQVGLRLYRERAWAFSFLSVAVLLTVSAITYLVVEKAEIAVLMAEMPEKAAYEGTVVRSYALEIGLGIFFGLPLTILLWGVWRWWYVKLLTWWSPSTLVTVQRQGTKRSIALGQPAFAPMESWLRSGILIKPVILLLIPCLVLTIFAGAYHSRVAMRLVHGSAKLDEVSQPHLLFRIEVSSNPRQIRLVRRVGVGTVNIYLSTSQDYEESVGSLESWSYGQSGGNRYDSIPLTDVEPGTYYLHFVQESGVGFFEYTVSHGGGIASRVSAIAYGLFLASSVALGLALIFVVALRLYHRGSGAEERA